MNLTLSFISWLKNLPFERRVEKLNVGALEKPCQVEGDITTEADPEPENSEAKYDADNCEPAGIAGGPEKEKKRKREKPHMKEIAQNINTYS